MGKAQHLGAQAHLRLEVGILLDLSQPLVLFWFQSYEA
jgi:hypothetical protein